MILEYSSLYSLDIYPIEYFFSSIKNRIRSRSYKDLDLIQSDFKSYIEMQVGIVGH